MNGNIFIVSKRFPLNFRNHKAENNETELSSDLDKQKQVVCLYIVLPWFLFLFTQLPVHCKQVFYKKNLKTKQRRKGKGLRTGQLGMDE